MAKIKKSDYIKLSRILIRKLFDENCFGKGSIYIDNLKRGIPQEYLDKVETVLDDIAGLQEDPDTYLDMLATVRAEVEQQFLVAISDRIESYGAGVQGIFLEDFEAAELEVAELLSFREIPPHVLRMVLLQICFDSKIEIVP